VRPATLAPLLVILGACSGEPASGEGAGAETASSGAASTGLTSGETSTGAPTTGEAEPLPGACADPIAPLSRGSAHLRVDPDGTLRDEHGRDLQLRGVNTGGRSKWAPYLPFEISEDASLAEVEAAAAAYFAPLRDWGLDTVRVPFSWEGLEPVQGQFDARYLDRYAAMIDAAWALELRVIVDFHQDVYASPFCGDGFPLWTIAGEHGPPRRDCPDWGLGYILDGEMRAAFDRFWADEDGLHTAFRAMWSKMAARVGAHPGVLGLELLNEPGWGSANDIDAWKQAVLMPFYTAMFAHLRAEVGDELLLFYDNPGIDAVGLTPTLHLRPEGEGLVYAPHLYDPALIKGNPGTGNDPGAQLQSVAAFVREAGVGALIGEFGYAHGAKDGPMWLARVVDELDATRLSATLWEYSRSAELWNHEDLSVVAADGQERAILDVYVRPWLRAVAGAQASFRWDAAAGVATAAWTGDGGVSELVLPPRLFPAGPADLSLTTVSGPTGACLTHDPGRGELRVRVPAGARVELRLAR